jgi:Xaa-Pro aminopeptidase
MQEQVLKKRQEILINKAQAQGITTLWISSPPNRFYLSGFTAQDGGYGESSGWLFLSKEASILITDHRYTLQARMEVKGVEVVAEANLKEALKKVINSLDLTKVGYEEEYITMGHMRRFLEVSNAEDNPTPRKPELTPIDPILSSLREIKEEGEIKILKQGAKLLSQLIEKIQDTIVEGMTEKELSNKITMLALEMGAEDLAFPTIVASGKNSALPHAVPGSRRLRKGEPIIVDVGIRYKGYMTDMTRTFFLGTPKKEFAHLYKLVFEAQSKAMCGLKAGLNAKDGDEIARGFFREKGLAQYFSHGLGHGVGLAVHEAPRIGPLSKDVLRSYHIVTVEPGLYLPEKGGVRIEDMVLLGEDGAVRLTTGAGIYEF